MNTRLRILVGAALALGVAAAAILLLRPAGPRSAALAARERAMQLLGEHIASRHPNRPVLVLANPLIRHAGRLNVNARFERAGVRGLRRGLGSGSSLTLVFPEILPAWFTNPQSIFVASDSRTPLSFIVEPASVEHLAQAHPECRVVVSLIGLPVGLDRREIWRQDDPRCFALLLPDLRLLGPPAAAEEAFERGKLLAAVAEEPPDRYPLIVTRENAAEVLEQHPETLGY